MRNALKLLLGSLLVWLLLIACSTAPAGSPTIPSADTNYGTSTRALQSNRIPDSVFRMTALRHLAITGMDCDYGDHTHCWAIGEIPAAIGKLRQLRTLRLNVNSITVLPAELANLRELRDVDLSDNPALGQVDVLAKLPALETLSLFGCHIQQLPADLSAWKHLRELGLAGNPISATEQARLRKALPGCRIVF